MRPDSGYLHHVPPHDPRGMPGVPLQDPYPQYGGYPPQGQGDPPPANWPPYDTGGGHGGWQGGPNPNRLIALIVAGIVVVALLGVSAWFAFGRTSKPSLPEPRPAADVSPEPAAITDEIQLLIDGKQSGEVEGRDVVLSWSGGDSVAEVRFGNSQAEVEAQEFMDASVGAIEWRLTPDENGRATVYMQYIRKIGLPGETHTSVTVTRRDPPKPAASTRPPSTPVIEVNSKFVGDNGKARDGGNGIGYFKPGEALSWHIKASNADGIKEIKFYFRNDITDTFTFNGERTVEKTWRMFVPYNAPDATTLPVYVKVTGMTGGEVKIHRTFIVDRSGPVVEVSHALPDANGIWRVPINVVDRGAGPTKVDVWVQTTSGNRSGVETEVFCVNGYTEPGCRSVDRSFVYTIDMSDFIGGATYQVVAQGYDWLGNKGELYKSAGWTKPAPAPAPSQPDPTPETPSSSPGQGSSRPTDEFYEVYEPVVPKEDEPPPPAMTLGTPTIVVDRTWGWTKGLLTIPFTSTRTIPNTGQRITYASVSATLTDKHGKTINLRLDLDVIAGQKSGKLHLSNFVDVFPNHQAGDPYQITFASTWHKEPEKSIYLADTIYLPEITYR